jgi:hypothetical protein
MILVKRSRLVGLKSISRVNISCVQTPLLVSLQCYHGLDTILTLLFIIALPSFISLHTKSVSEGLDHVSSIGLKDQYLTDETASRETVTGSLVQRLLRYTKSPTHIIQSQTVREIFNDLQHVLRDDYFTNHLNEKDWNPRIMEDVIQVRNLMNVTQKLPIADNLRGT